MHTLDVIFGAFERLFPPTLIGKSQIAQLNQVLGQFTEAIAGGYVLECRLHEHEAQVDVGLCIDPAVDQGRDWLAGALPASLQAIPRWATISRLCQRWSETGSPLQESVSTLWLEFDMDGTPSPLPSLFLGFNGQPAAQVEQCVLLAAAELQVMPSSAMQAQFQRVLAGLPDGAEVFQVGWMLSRPASGSAMRVCVRGKPGEPLFAYLPGVGWQGDATALRVLLARLGEFVDVLALDFDVTPEGIGARLGIECRYEKWKQPQQEPRWQLFLNWMREQGLCSPAKQAALLSWTRVSTHVFAGETLPSALMRLLNHVKIVFVEGQPHEAKGYLLFGRRSAAFIKAQQNKQR